MTLTNILAAVDRFPQDEAVLVRALEIAKRHGAALTIVHIIDLPADMTLPAGIDTLHGQAEIAARDRINEALRRHGIDPADIEIRIESGAPALRLIEICDELGSDLVVMRAHQRIGIAENILGSTTERVIAAGHRPVRRGSPKLTSSLPVAAVPASSGGRFSAASPGACCATPPATC